MKNSICVKILRKFTSPLTMRKTVVGSYLNVPHNRFWMKRMLDKDCEQVKSKPKIKLVADNNLDKSTQDKSSKKGSK